MSYTNSTPNYGLPQYVADDKPTYLGDFNKAMLDIDTNMKQIDNKAVSSVSTANSANANATEALETATSASTTASRAQTTADTANTVAQNAQKTASNAQASASSANSTATSAKSTADTALANSQSALSNSQSALSQLAHFNLDNTTVFNNTNITPGEHVTSIQSTSALNFVADDTNSIFKLYGVIGCNTQNEGGNMAVSFQTTLRPSSKITLSCVGIALYDNNGRIDNVNAEIETNGKCTLKSWFNTNNTDVKLILWNSLYLLQDFNDTPSPINP